MSEAFMVKSKFLDYAVAFTDDFAEALSHEHNKNSFFILDTKILELYAAKTGPSLSPDRMFPVEANEYNKTLDYCASLIKKLVEMGIRKNSTIVAIGGGVIQDIAAFTSSVLYRGIGWVFYPTTLLAQADSCVGSKTSINLDKFKNLIGNFYPPTQINIDVGFLETLPVSEIKSGIGEMLHFYLIAGSEKAEQLIEKYSELTKERGLLKEFIAASLDIKRKVVEVDEFDKNERNLFNYGHTFGHAIETVSEYTVNHGQAVTMGMDIANFVSLQLGSLGEKDFALIHKILVQNMPEFSLDQSRMNDYLKALSRDKKNSGSNLGCILSKGPGSMYKALLPLDENLREILLSYFDSQENPQV